MELGIKQEQWDRFMRSIKVDEQGCWVWQKAKQANGYGRVAFRDKGLRREWVAHRASWTYLRGVVPPGLVLDHLCRNRACVNPDHLEPVTQSVNCLRGNTGLRGGKRRNHEGHEFRVAKGTGNRYCYTCNQSAQKAWRDRRRNSAQVREQA